MNDERLFQILGSAAVVGGALRVGSSFIPWASGVPWLEALAFVIDGAQLGWFGFVAFALAETGIGSIIGPDTTAFGIDTYQAGVAAISIGLVLLSLQMLLRRAGSAIAAVCWILSLAAGVGGGAMGQADRGFFAGGILFGLGFVIAGAGLLRATRSRALASR
jgi:hypothetical protein